MFHISGTNLNVRQRLALFFMYICTIMFANGIFYGLDQSPIQDVLASFIISLCGSAPQRIIKVLFRAAKPREGSSSKLAKYQRKVSEPTVHQMAKIRDAQEMREKMYNGMYPLPSYVRDIGWILLVLLSATSCCAAVCCPNIVSSSRYSERIVRIFRSFTGFQFSLCEKKHHGPINIQLFTLVHSYSLTFQYRKELTVRMRTLIFINQSAGTRRSA